MIKLPRVKLIQYNYSNLFILIVDLVNTFNDYKYNVLSMSLLSYITDQKLSKAYSSSIDYTNSFDTLELSNYLKVEVILAKINIKTLLN